MADIISLLPESLSNQIAAGEVVQRPASVVKELLENAIDAGSTSIKLIVKDGGKSLIQVIDNGKGMSITDARMCFERHATSKLKTTEDLFRIKTKGFRGEALAAIAAVAQVELKTCQQNEALGTLITIEGGKVTLQEPCQHPHGSSFSVKNLFFNVPARRNFLKDDSVELKHIIEEFERVALAHPDVSFALNSNKNDLFVLPASSLMQRICGIFGNHLNSKLVAIGEETPYLKIKGFVAKPEAAVKKRGIQFFFVNNRFIKSGYLHFAVANAYKDLIAAEMNPYYFIFLDLPAESIDINIHPTKTEIKFEDERTVFMLLQSSVQRALGKAHVAPDLTFDNEHTFDLDYSKKITDIKAPTITVNTSYNPFKTNGGMNLSGSNSSLQKAGSWDNEFEKYKTEGIEGIHSIENQTEYPELFEKQEPHLSPDQIKVFQLMNRYLVCESANGIMVIDQQRAHEQVLYESYVKAFKDHVVASQQELFPISAELSLTDFTLLMELKDDLKNLGFDVEALGKNTIAIHGTPANLQGQNGKEVLESVLENFKLNNLEVKTEQKENLCRAMASGTSIKIGKSLSEHEMKDLIIQLFACENHMYTPSGKNIIAEYPATEIDKLFKRRN